MTSLAPAGRASSDCENGAKKIREKNASMSGIRQRRANSKVRFRVASYDRWIVGYVFRGRCSFAQSSAYRCASLFIHTFRCIVTFLPFHLCPHLFERYSLCPVIRAQGGIARKERCVSCVLLSHIVRREKHGSLCRNETTAGKDKSSAGNKKSSVPMRFCICSLQWPF